MSILWKWVDGKGFSVEGKRNIFLILNCLLFSILGFGVWLIISKFALSTWDWAFCFIGYPGFFVGIIGGFLYLCRQ